MALRLEGDVAPLEKQDAVLDELPTVRVGRIELGLLVLEDGLSVDDVPDRRRPRRPRARPSPIRPRGRSAEVEFVQCRVTSSPAMTTFVPGVQRLAVGRSSGPVPPRNWTSIETGEALVQAHALRRLAVEHHAAVPEAPGGAAGDLVRRRTRYSTRRTIAPEGLLIEEMPEFPVELLVPVIGHLEDAVLDPEGVLVVQAGFVLGELRGPALEVPAVEQADPASRSSGTVPCGDSPRSPGPWPPGGRRSFRSSRRRAPRRRRRGPRSRNGWLCALMPLPPSPCYSPPSRPRMSSSTFSTSSRLPMNRGVRWWSEVGSMSRMGPFPSEA